MSIIGAFTGLALDHSPAAPVPFCAFAALTAGQGEAEFTLEIARQTGPLDDEVVERFAGHLRFIDPLQTVYWLYRFTRFSFPLPGEYLFTLRIDGEWMAQRRLRVYSQEESA